MLNGSWLSIRVFLSVSLRFHVDRHVDVHGVEQGLGIPVGEAKAAAGFGAADFLGFGGAVDAIARQI